MSLDAEVRALLAQVVGSDKIPAEGEVTREAAPAWDSLKHVDLIFLLEETFEIELTEEEMGEADSLSKIVALVGARRAA